MKTRSVSEHVEGHLWLVNIVAPILFSAAIGTIAVLASLWFQLTVVRSVAGSVKAHLATLVETQDRPEIYRLLNSMKQQNGFDVVVVQDGIVIGSTRSLSEIEKPLFRTPWLSNLALKVEQPLSREVGPEISSSLVSFVPLARPLFISFCLGAVTFLLGLGVGLANRHLTRRGIKTALFPLESLSSAIRGLADPTPPVLEPVSITELDEIRKTVMATQLALLEAREKLTRAHAKEMAADAYRRLIHDLRTPVSTLQKLASAAERYPQDAAVQDETRKRIPKLTNQILGQLSAASKTLEFEEPNPTMSDLRVCISEAKDQIEVLAAKEKDHSIDLVMPDSPVEFPNDSVLLTRALLNLLKNSLEAGAKTLRISLSYFSQGLPSILVEDDGPGLDPAELPPFLKGRGQSTKRKRFGLGLATVNHIANLHGAKVIYRESSLGGAGFEVRFQKEMIHE